MAIDMDRPAPPHRPHRRPAAAQVSALLLLAGAAVAPSASQAPVRPAPPPPPSYCSGHPIPGGRLDIVQDGHYVILDATNDTVVGSGTCPS